MAATFKIYNLPAVAVATPIKLNVDPANEPPHYVQACSFEPSTASELYIGGSNVANPETGIVIEEGDVLYYEGNNSRGETKELDLINTYYIGGACKLIVEERA